MPPRLFAASLGFGALILAAPQVQAAPASCGPRAQVLAEIAVRHGQSRRAVGLASTQVVVEIFASDATGRWTITLTLPTGLTCMLASGEAYESLGPVFGTGA
ncbi:MAG: hypothetical protein K0B00_09775 [Rhodobacteraceae bacterium]|nr:hypothetical protein [Paracoccaceae bacterium]